jgi:hypothetical protein
MGFEFIEPNLNAYRDWYERSTGIGKGFKKLK